MIKSSRIFSYKKPNKALTNNCSFNKILHGWYSLFQDHFTSIHLKMFNLGKSEPLLPCSYSPASNKSSRLEGPSSEESTSPAEVLTHALGFHRLPK